MVAAAVHVVAAIAVDVVLAIDVGVVAAAMPLLLMLVLLLRLLLLLLLLHIVAPPVFDDAVCDNGIALVFCQLHRLTLLLHGNISEPHSTERTSL